MSAWPTDERIMPARRPHPTRWLVFALLSFVAIFVTAGLAPEFEEGQDPTAPWAVGFVLAFVGTVVGLVGAGVSAIRARRFRAGGTSEGEGSTPLGRQGLYLTLGGLAIVIVTMTVRRVVVEPRPEDDLGAVAGTFATIGVCLMIWGLSKWGVVVGRLMAKGRMVRNLQGAERIEPTPEEEAHLQRVFAEMAAQGRVGSPVYWRAAAGLPTDMREADLTVPLDPAATRAMCRAVVDAERAGILEDGEDLLCAWWFMGSALTGNPVLVTLAFEGDGLGGTHVTVRAAVKFYFSNQDLAQEALERLLAAFDVRERATT